MSSNLTSVPQLTGLAHYQNGVIIINFWASWSQPSVHMNSVIDALALSNRDFTFLKVEAEEVAELSEMFEVDSVPTIVFLQHGKMLDLIKGASPPQVTARVASLRTGLASNTTATSQPDINTRLKQLINSAKVMAFIKGTPAAPQCGFSRRFVEMLKNQGIQFGSFNILSDVEVREGLKKFSNWPTYPQLYINGELVGGLDICLELAEEGELRAMVPEDYLSSAPSS